MARYHITGGAVPTTVSGTVASSGAATVAITDATGWPDASVGPYHVVIDPGESNEEVVLVTARSGTNLTVTSGNRGADGTSAAAHSDGAVIYPCISATYIDEANAHQNSASVHLGTGTIQTAHFAAGAVDAAAIGSSAVTESKINSGAVTEAKIGTAAVTATKLASDAVTTAKILDANVTTAKIADGNVTIAKIPSGFRFHGASASAPSSPSRGDTWVDTDTMELFVYYGATTGWAREWNKPWGRVASGYTTSNQGSITGTVVDLTNQTTTFTAVANRYYQVVVTELWISTVSNDQILVYLTNGSNSVREQFYDTLTSSNTGQRRTWVTQPFTLSAGSETLKVRAWRNFGSGTITVQSSSVYPSGLTVIDIGPSSTAPSS